MASPTVASARGAHYLMARSEEAITTMTPFGLKSRKPRRKVERKAWFTGDGDFALQPCTIVDMSSDGARLSLDGATRLPAKFRLTFSRTTREGVRCDLRWRDGRTAGVSFAA